MPSRSSSRRAPTPGAAVVVAVAAVVLAGCVAHPIGPARSDGSYAAKAATTIESAISAAETVRLLADTAADGGAFASYTAVAVSEQEDALGGLRGTFMSIQPPAGLRSAQLRDELSALLTDVFDHVGEVRIQVRRGNLDQLDAVAGPLEHDVQALNDLLDTLP